MSIQATETKVRSLRKFWNTRLGTALIAVAAIFAVAILAPTLDPPGAREQANAVGYLRSIGVLEASHRIAKGSVTCDWAELATTAPAEKDRSYVGARAKLFAERDGKMFHYTLVLSGCESPVKNDSRKYTAVAVPDKVPGLRLRAFCSDETGTIYYDRSGSAEDCLTKKNPLK